MNLLNYYQKRGTSCDVPNDAELRQDISNLLGIAVMLEGPGFRSAQEQEKTLAENHDKIIGFAYYLLDYQGVHDKIFATQARLFSIFAGMIFLRNIPFANAEHRLLEISQKFELATLHPEKENVAGFILCNFENYKKEELQQIRCRIETLAIADLCDKPNVNLLYKSCCRELSWWQILF